MTTPADEFHAKYNDRYDPFPLHTDSDRISLSYLTKCHAMFPDPPYKNQLCRAILTGSLDVDDYIVYSNNPSQLYKLDNDILHKLRILEAIDCFKFAIENGYPYHYDNFKYNSHSRHATTDKRDDPTYRNDTVAIIVRLFFINSQDVRDFIVYYFGLFPEIRNDQRVINYILQEVFVLCTDGTFGVMTELFTHIIKLLLSLGLNLEIVYYDTLEEMKKSTSHNLTNNQLMTYIQIGLDMKIKISRAALSAINTIARPILAYNPGPPVFILSIIPVILTSLHNIKTVPVDEIQETLSIIIFNYVSFICNIYYCGGNDEVLTPNFSAYLRRLLMLYYNKEVSFDEMVDTLIDAAVRNIDQQENMSYDMEVDIPDDIEAIKRYMIKMDCEPALLNYVEYCAKRLSTIKPFHLPFDVDRHIHVYKVLGERKIANYDRWYAAERDDIRKSNKIKLRWIIHQRIDDAGENQKYSNILNLSDFIAEYC